MKRIFTLLFSIVLLCQTTLLWAQSSMVITKTDGTQISIHVAEIENVTFPSDDRLQVAITYGGYWLHPGQWAQLEAVVTTPDGEETYADITWKSTDEAVAKVNEDGVVTGVGDGSCKILAVTDEGQGVLPVNVVTRPMLDIEVNEIGNRSCTYTITPTDPEIRYYYDYRVQSGEYSVDRLDQYGSEEQNIYHFAIDWWKFCGSMYGCTWQEFMNEYGLCSGVQSERQTELIENSQYCVFAFALNENGSLASPVELTKFCTTAPEPSDITFEVTVNDPGNGVFTIVPSNDDPYFVNVQRASYVEWFVERDNVESTMVNSLVEAVKPDVYPEAYCSGTVTRSATDFLASLRSDEDYYIIVFGYNDGLTSPVTLVKFHTNP